MNLYFVRDIQFLVNFNLLYCNIKLIFLDTTIIWFENVSRKKKVIK